MTVLVLARAPAGLRGLLSRWFLEVQANVFVGTVSARVRDKLWEKVVAGHSLGGAVLVYRALNEQGFAIRTIGDLNREIVDMDGMLLVRKPTPGHKHG